MFDISSEKSTELLNKMIDYTALKQKVIANNIANINTPGYKRLDVSFSQNLKSAIENGESVKEMQLKVVVDKSKNIAIGTRNDGNTVDIDKEVSQLMQNSLSYNVYLELMAFKFKMATRAMRSR
ncbi:MAG: flagellar basal body rod protein FlgB [Candidatus Anammoxibacter sp.]